MSSPIFRPMPKLTRSFFPFLAAGLLALVCSGCSPQAKKARHLAQADRYFAGGKYDEAEIEYKNALQIEGLNPQAISQLGLIYFDEGRVGLAYNFLKKGNEPQPDNLALRIKLGAIDMIVGQLDEAKKEAIYILDHKPGDAE